MEIIFEIIGEFLLQVVGEILFELGFHSVLEIRKRRTARNPIVATVGYCIVGALIGGVSLLVFPHSLISPDFEMLNLILTPIVAGSIMSVMGWWRRKRGQEIIRLDKFFFGFLFAFCMAFVRYNYTI